jgi:hypothetical protein
MQDIGSNGHVTFSPHPAFGHLLPVGEGTPGKACKTCPLPSGEGGAKRRVRGYPPSFPSSCSSAMARLPTSPWGR